MVKLIQVTEQSNQNLIWNHWKVKDQVGVLKRSNWRPEIRVIGKANFKSNVN